MVGIRESRESVGMRDERKGGKKGQAYTQVVAGNQKTGKSGVIGELIRYASAPEWSVGRTVVLMRVVCGSGTL
jgi:hypothetical protein